MQGIKGEVQRWRALNVTERSFHRGWQMVVGTADEQRISVVVYYFVIFIFNVD